MADTSSIENLVAELRRGTQVYAVLTQLHRGQYGYSLLQSLSEKGVSIDAGTLYPLLRRLESQGLLASEWDTTESRPRKYYQLSEDGKVVLRLLQDEWKKIVHEMDQLVKENSHE